MTVWNLTILSKSLGENSRPPRFPQLVVELKKRWNVIVIHFDFSIVIRLDNMYKIIINPTFTRVAKCSIARKRNLDFLNELPMNP